jgi:hypothetical protein
MHGELQQFRGVAKAHRDGGLAIILDSIRPEQPKTLDAFWSLRRCNMKCPDPHHWPEPGVIDGIEKAQGPLADLLTQLAGIVGRTPPK